MYLKRYMEHIKRGDFFEAHEVLEEVWQKLRRSNDPIQYAYKGLINAAVALELQKRGRDNYMRVWKNFDKYKKFYPIDKRIFELSLEVEKLKPKV